MSKPATDICVVGDSSLQADSTADTGKDNGTQAPSNSDDRVLAMLFGFLVQELANSSREVSKGLALGKRFIDEGKVVARPAAGAGHHWLPSIQTVAAALVVRTVGSGLAAAW
jgi:hypothetical protein